MKKTTWILFAILLVLVWTSMLQAKTEVTPVDAGKIPLVPSQGGSKDEIYIYGGPGTLEGKFETEAGDPDRQGWTSHDLSIPDETPDEFQIDTSIVPTWTQAHRTIMPTGVVIITMGSVMILFRVAMGPILTPVLNGK